MPVSSKFMGIGRSQVRAIAGSTTFAGLTDVDVTGAPQGSVLYYNGSKWVDLSYGTVDQVLTTNGIGANPSWTNKTSATGIVGGTDTMVQFNDGGSSFGGQSEFTYTKTTGNLKVSQAAGYSFTAGASGSSQVSSGLDIWDYNDVQSLQVGYNNLKNESYIWATQTGNEIKFGTEGVKRMEIDSGGSVYTSGDLHASGTLSAVTNNLVATATLWTQKGDLVVGTGSDTAQRLASAAGDNGQVLTIATGETTGLLWADPGGVEVIARYHVPVASASTGTTGSRYVSSPIRIDPVGGDWEDGNVVITDDPGIGTVSTTGLGKLSLISQAGGVPLASVTSGSATTIAKFGSITNHTSTIQFLHNGYSDADILSKFVMTSGTTTIGATGSHKFILTGGLGITAQSSKPSDSVTNPALWVSGTSNLLYLSDVGMVTANSSTLTAGYVPYVSGAAKNGVGNSVLYNDATNSRIGINTASPNRDLDVRGTTLLSGAVGVTGTAEVSSTLTVKSDIIGTGTATLSTGALDNIKLDPSTGTAYIKLQDTSRTATTAGKQPELLLLQNQIDTSTHKANFPTIRWQKAGPVDALSAYTNLGYRMYVSGETGFGTVSAPQSMVWDYNADVADPANYQELMSLSSAGALTINRAYTLPTAAAGSNGYVITGNTNGTTGWAAQSGGGGVGGYWGLNGSKIHYTSGNVGIGTTDPDALLTVRGTSDLPIMILSGSGDTTYHYKTTGSGDISFQYHVNQGRSADIALISNADGAEKTTIRQKVVDANNSEMLFRTRDAGTLTNTMILSGSKVGIGTTSPAYTLDVNGAINTDQDYYLKRTGGAFYYQNNAGTNLWALYETSGDLAVYDYQGGGAQMVTFKNGGNVGIGTTGPDAKLEVLSTTDQLQLTHTDASKYNSFHTDAGGGLSIYSNGTARANRKVFVSGTSIIMGQYAGYDLNHNQTGEHVIIGDRAGYELKGNETHGRHTIIGAQAVYTASGSSGSDYITAIGAYCAYGASPLKGFTALGSFAGYYLSGSGDGPLLLGAGAGKGTAFAAWGTVNGVTMDEDVLIGNGGVAEYAETLSQNTIVGSRAAGFMRVGTQNVAIGRFAMRNASGSNGTTGNVTIGQSAGSGIGKSNKTNGSRYNIAIGYETQEKELVGDRNIAIGYKVGIDGADTADDILRIGNAVGDWSYIRGDMANDNFWVGATTPIFTVSGGNVGIGTGFTALTNKLHVEGNTYVNGVLTATAKSFDIPHPDKEGKRLIHGSLEGPEHGVYIRGTAKGYDDTVVELPDYWESLVGEDYTLQLTSYNSSTVYIVEKGPKSFTVGSNALTYSFDYFAVGMREKIEVEIDGN